MKAYFGIAGLAMIAACTTTSATYPFDIVTVEPRLETDGMGGNDDMADDPAVWVHGGDAAKSVILGTNKEAGLYVYDLSGEEVQFLPVGRVNNVDLRGNIAVASNDEVNGISWFAIDASTAEVSHLGDTPIETIEPYGICSGMVAGHYTAAVTFKTGRVEIWSGDMVNGVPTATLSRTVLLPSQLEGCAFDDANARLFIGEEAFGVYSLHLGDTNSSPVVVDRISSGNGLVADVEGLSLWEGADGKGYLVVSAQEADHYVVYDRLPPHAPRGIFTIGESADGSIDAVTHTDGLDVISTPLPGYPNGLLVVQDDGNPNSGQDQNFKLVDWADVTQSLDLDN